MLLREALTTGDDIAPSDLCLDFDNFMTAIMAAPLQFAQNGGGGESLVCFVTVHWSGGIHQGDTKG